jgi:2-succinyl-6-hydroxy-2,4-cyclohexadiene-1-carboxylate synthase
MPHVDVDGLVLNVDRYGMGPPVVLLHGFTGSRTSWYDVVKAIDTEFTTLSVDLIGHGWSGSPPTVDRYEMSRAVDDLVEMLHRIGFERAVWVGYSLGVWTALQLAVQHPEAVSALVLEGASPGLATEQERADRIAADEALARKLETEGLEAFIDYWQSIPLWDSQKTTLTEPQRVALRQQRLAQRAPGLANSLRGMGTGSQMWVGDRLGNLGVPVLLTAGRLDTKFSAIAAEMAQAIPDARLEIIEAAGHCAHLEQPAAFNAVLLDFLRGIRARL